MKVLLDLLEVGEEIGRGVVTCARARKVKIGLDR